MTDKSRRTRAKVVAITSPRGGTGKSVTATNLASLLAQSSTAPQVCVVDADLLFGDVCLMLGLETRPSIVDAVRAGADLDETSLSSMLIDHPDGFKVLAAPPEPVYADEVSPGALTSIVGVLSDMFDYVIVDTASLVDEVLLAVLDLADRVLFFVDADRPSLTNARISLETLQAHEVRASKIRLILNRWTSDAAIKSCDARKELGLDVSGVVPLDPAVKASVEACRPVVEFAPTSEAARGLRSVMDLVVGRE